MAHNTEKLRELLERVESASGPDRGLDADLAFALGAFDYKLTSGFEDCRIERDDWRTNDVVGVIVRGRGRLHYEEKYERYTASLDASIALVERMLPGWHVDADLGASVCEDGTFGARIWPPEGYRNNAGEGNTPPLAILSALLRALISQAEGEGA